MKETCSFAKEMGKRVAQRRKELGLTQEKAAERCGLSQQFFASIETGGKTCGRELAQAGHGAGYQRRLPAHRPGDRPGAGPAAPAAAAAAREEYRHMLTVIKEYLWALGRR